MAFDNFEQTGNIGKSPEEKFDEINKFQQARAQAEKEKTTADSFYKSLPKDVRIAKKQLREVKIIKKQ